MIRLIGNGRYLLIETKNWPKVITLENNFGRKSRYAMTSTNGTREILKADQQPHEAECILAAGKYRLYEVKNEPGIKTCKHLELFIGEGYWQGYLLPAGFPIERKTGKKIIPTKELITKRTH